VVVLNDGANLVSQALVQLAAARGLKTVTLIRADTGPHFDVLSPHLTALGAGMVLSEAAAATHAFTKTLADFKGGVLGLNASGGAAALTVARALAPGATLVTYGTASRRTPALTAPLDLFTAADLTLRGFSLGAWAARTAKGARDSEVAAAAKAVSGAAPAVRTLVAREPFADFGAALKRATAAVCERPVVLTF
jgi:trans-2-enoyl-CoA reductase